ncbi:PREDICTED: Ig-like V-type domain-containing protein FAM187A [Trachymyrmex cornetzi]|uniref:Ig-like V-type domain-containing protein FAM187A n=1 Tax=Trachymyrmex cornetzi TaxID=471704 RepID=UPI00084F082F|nr:PREDICTED: Ig-like V-type domain-containing protein FAM187A [Trachymyrmex cornetzi]
MYVIWIIIASLTSRNCVANDGTLVNVNKYCRDKDRLITSEENDEYLLIAAENNTNIMLACRFCNDHEEPQPKIWYYQDHYRENPEKEVELEMDNNISYSRIYTTPDLSLVMKSFTVIDVGIYRCHGKEGQEEEKKYNYRIELLLKDIGGEFLEKGNITEWGKYQEIYLWPVNIKFAVSKMTDLAEIREEGVILQVISEWGPWSPCEQCINNRGIKTSRGYCRLKRNINSTMLEKNDSVIIYFFRESPMLPCKSVLLQSEFPSISRIVRYLPEFILTEPCKKCPRVKKRKKGEKFRYAKRYVLAEGAHLAVTCPESTIETQVIWKKDALTLKKGTAQSFRQKDREARVMVDTFSTLYLTDVSQEEQGNYTCYVDNINMMRMKIIVISKTRLLTQGILRRCVSCRSRGDLGSCKDPFTMNSTQIALEKGIDAVPCVSGWCGKIIESQNLNNEYGIATQRLCFQRGPDDNEERCAYTVWNYKKVYMCLCYGDLCNGMMKTTIASSFLITLSVCLTRWLI